jgi:hypothetical protein
MKRLLFLIAALASIALADPPASNVIIDTSNPITSSLKLLVYPSTVTNANIVKNASGGNDPVTLVGSAAITPGAGRTGGSALVSPGGASGASWPTPNPGIYGSTAHDWTIFIQAKIDSWPGAYSFVAAIPHNATNTEGGSGDLASGVSLGMMRNGTSNNAAIYFTSNPNFKEFHGGTAAFYTLGSWHTYAMVKSGSNALFYRDGTLIDTVAIGGDYGIGWGNAAYPFALFNQSGVSGVAGNGPAGSSDVAAIWARALNATELTSLNTDPYQLVTTPPPTYNITGTVTSTAVNAQVRITGTGVDQTVIADASGNFAFTPVIAGTYQVTPSRLGVVFSPTSRFVTVTSSDQTANFTATNKTFGPAAITLEGLTPSQIGILITGAGSTPCTLNLFQGTSIDGIPHPDVTNSVDTSRSDTVTTTNTRRVWIGHNINNLALFEGEAYFLHADCSTAGQATLLFTTPHPPTATTPTPPVPFDASKPYNYGGPDFDLTQSGVKVALPYSGVAAEVPIGPFDRWWEALSNAEGLGFNVYAGGPVTRVGGSGWTIPSGSLDGANSPSAYATIANTNAAIVMPANTLGRHSDPALDQETVGLQVWGSGTDSTAANRVFNACITTNMVAGTCDTNSDQKYSSTPYIQITLPTGSSMSVSNSATLAGSLSKVGNTPWPAQYPTPGYIGWNTFVPSDRLAVPNITISGISSGVVSASKNWGDSGFIPEGLAGNYLYIPGLSNANCPGDLCPVASVLPNGQAKLAAPADTINATGPFSGAVAYQYGIKIWKATSTGTVSLAVRYTVAGRRGQNPGTAGTANCSTVPKTINGKKGSNCLFTMSNHSRSVVWVPDDRNVKALYRSSLNWSTSNSFNTSIPNSADRPGGSNFTEDPYDKDAFWDTTDPDTLYTYVQTQGGSYAILKGVLDQNPPTDPASCLTTYDATCRTYWNNVVNGSSVSWQTGHILWTNLTPASATPAMDVFSQVNRAYPSYSANYPGYTGGGWAWVGVSGSIGWLKNDGGAQDANPCLIAAFDLSQTPANLIRFFSTMSDSDMLAETNGGIEEMRWGACHGVFQDTVFPNSVTTSNNPPGSKGFSGGILGTPVQFKPTAIMMQDGSWNSNTALQWPPPAAGGSSPSLYKSDYPGSLTDLKPRIAKYVYATNQFARIRAAGSGSAATVNWVCNSSTDMAAAGYPACVWDGTKYAMPIKWKPIEGDAFTWSGSGSCISGDRATCEHLIIAKINSVTDSFVDMWVIRATDHVWNCLPPNLPQIDGTTGTSLGGCVSSNVGDYHQFSPINGWLGNMIPGNQGAEYVKRVQLDPATGSTVSVAMQMSEFAGHSTSGLGMDGKKHLIGYVSAIAAANMSDLNALYYTGNSGVTAYHQNYRPSFAGVYGGIGPTQSYLNDSAYRPDSIYRGSGVDLHHFANSGGGMDLGDKTRTLAPVAGMTDVYKYPHSDFTGVSGCNAACQSLKYRNFAPLYGFGGQRIYKDRSGPACDMNTAPNYTICYNYRTGITSGVAGSVLGDLFVKAPGVDYTDTLPFSNNGVVQPVISFLGPMEGGLEQYMWQTDDYEGGRWFRFLGFTGPPGFAQGYSEPSLNSYGNKVLTQTANLANGMVRLPLIVHLPNQSTYVRDWSKTNLPSFKSGSTWNASFEVKVPAYAGATHARIKFGTTNTFQCTEASEACYTDEAHTSATDTFAFLGEASSPTPCSTGCTLHPPVLPGRLTLIQIEHTNSSGTVIATEPAQFVAVR